MAITDTIRATRERKGLTQEGLADRLETTRSNYAYLEGRGKKLTIEQLQSIANALDVPVSDLLGIESQTSTEDAAKVKGLEKEVGELKEEVGVLHDLSRMYKEREKRHSDFISYYYHEIDYRIVLNAYFYGILSKEDVTPFMNGSLEKLGGGIAESLVLPHDYEYPEFVTHTSRLMKERQIAKALILLRRVDATHSELLAEMFHRGLVNDEKLKRAYAFRFSKEYQQIHQEMNKEIEEMVARGPVN